MTNLFEGITNIGFAEHALRAAMKELPARMRLIGSFKLTWKGDFKVNNTHQFELKLGPAGPGDTPRGSANGVVSIARGQKPHAHVALILEPIESSLIRYKISVAPNENGLLQGTITDSEVLETC